MPGKQDGPSVIIYGPPRLPRIAKNAHFFTLEPIYEKLVIIFFPCYKLGCCVGHGFLLHWTRRLGRRSDCVWVGYFSGHWFRSEREFSGAIIAHQTSESASGSPEFCHLCLLMSLEAWCPELVWCYQEVRCELTLLNSGIFTIGPVLTGRWANMRLMLMY